MATPTNGLPTLCALCLGAIVEITAHGDANRHGLCSYCGWRVVDISAPATSSPDPSNEGAEVVA